MIEEKVKLETNRSVIEQILDFHKITYKQLAQKLGITDRALRNLRNGERGLRLNMSQIKILQSLLQPFDKKLEDLPDDWILEKKEEVAV